MARTTKTKAIADSVGSSPTGSNDSTSSVAAMSFDRALSPRQAYELNPVFRRAVNVIAENESKATIRLFSRKSGAEITSGPAFDLFKRPSRYTSGSRFLCDMVKMYKITGEIAILPLVEKNASTPTALKLLNPSVLSAYPVNVKSLDFVTHWMYNDGLAIDGKSPIMQIPHELLVFAKNFNPHSGVRGLSEAVTLINEISTNYYVQRYNISRFKNGVKGDVVFIFPKGTKKAVVTDHVERWQEQHSIANDNGFSVAGIIGDDVKIEQLDAGGKDGEFLNLSSYNDEKIAGLLGVPASVIGFYQKSRFDTIDAEIEHFTESVILPDLRSYSEVFQTQIVDRYFKSAVGMQKKEIGKMTKAFATEYSRAMDTYVDSDLIVVLDPDSLPIMAKLNKAKVAHAKELREALDMSATEAAEYVGIDIQHNPLRDDIWVPAGRTNLNAPIPSPTSNKDAVVEDVEAVKDALQEIVKANEASVPPVADKALQEALKGFYRDFRAAALAAHEEGEMVDKQEFICKAREIGAAVVTQVHRDYLELRNIQKNGYGKEKVKAYFNTVSKPSALKVLLGSIS